MALPTEYNPGKKHTGNAQWGERIGNIPDGYLALDNVTNVVGVPSTPVFRFLLNAPNAADADYFFNDLVATATGTFYPTLATTMQTNNAYGVPFSRNISVTPNQETTGTIVINGIDTQGKAQSVTVAFAAASAAAVTNCCFTSIVSVEITVAFDADTTLDIGFDDKFGLPYPMYGISTIMACYDGAGTTYPGIDATNFAITTDWTVTAGAPATAGADRYGTFNITGATDTDPDGTANYAYVYCPTYYFSPSGVAQYPTSSISTYP